jgi:hypothetical protein
LVISITVLVYTIPHSIDGSMVSYKESFIASVATMATSLLGLL